MPPIDPDTQRRIAELLVELRGWHPGVPEASLPELCERFQLPTLVVKRLADSEGFELAEEDGVPSPADSQVDTQPIELGDDDDA